MSIIRIFFNGQAHDVDQGLTLDAALHTYAQKSIEAGDPIATAVNGRHVSRQARSSVILADQDAITTFEPITGG
ncbi:sulfur carrier protein ThiS [Allopusillimonas ginsengisoli]|uniref:sulfur carrier protein ThiS n=1 Tax=Allopusillimonas ginsengisoli TaxID=453575 RepID=UPI00101FA665|nr:sulfur carrier protein ThiS [Allopusillimonas ginsengisoli]TEA78438.1 thiamine biosynthesis protein ThiS [Allopusillimonas ginsengisoli]